MTEAELHQLNQRELRKLMLAVRTNANQLALLLAICDDRNLQAELMQQYEATLRQQGVATYRTRLELKQPSLKATLAALVEQVPQLQAGEKAVVTVLGSADLLGVKLNEEKSEQEKFFFSLQWTREALRGFEFPVVVWLSETIATRLAQEAQDFWSWRSGVFEFQPESRLVELPTQQNWTPAREATEEVKPTGSIQDLQQQIAALTQQNPQSPLLVTLYNDLGDAYRQKYDHQQALQCYEQALELARTLTDQTGQARSLNNLGLTLFDCGRYFKAIDFHQQALEIAREIGYRNGEAACLANLGLAYYSLGQNQRAIDFHQQALEIMREIGDRNGEGFSLSNLGFAYDSLGQYQRAIDFHQQALEIMREIGHCNGEANSLSGLGNAYFFLGQNQRAIDFHQQALEIRRKVGDHKGEAASLNGLGNAYCSLEQYQRAIDFHQQALEIAREIGYRNGEAASLDNLANAYYLLGQYQRAIDFYQQALEIAREIGDRNGEADSLGNLGNAYCSLGQYQRAIDFYQQALEIMREIGYRWGEGNSLLNLGNAFARTDQHYEALQSYQQALAIYEALELKHKVEECKTAIAQCNQMIAVEIRRAPSIDDAPHRQDDWWEKGLPTPTKQSAPRPTPQPPALWQTWGLWFAVGLGVALLFWWLRR